jgi:hypothetical protein
MTIKLGSFEIIIFEVVYKRQELFNIIVETEVIKRETEAIKNSDSFKALQEQARIMRAKRKEVTA